MILRTQTPRDILKPTIQIGDYNQLKQFSLQNQNSCTQLMVKLVPCQIPKYIQSIKFPRLLTLSLVNSELKSIEPITQIQIPLVQHLSLSNNKLTCIQGLRKGYWKRLKEVNLCENKILEHAQGMEEMETANNVWKVTIDSPAILEWKWIFKMKAFQIGTLGKLTLKKPMIKILLGKYPSLKLIN